MLFTQLTLSIQIFLLLSGWTLIFSVSFFSLQEEMSCLAVSISPCKWSLQSYSPAVSLYIGLFLKTDIWATTWLCNLHLSFCHLVLPISAHWSSWQLWASFTWNTPGSKIGVQVFFLQLWLFSLIEMDFFYFLFFKNLTIIQFSEYLF